jgi:RimJ/RimL family protein N-acetyltransferase
VTNRYWPLFDLRLRTPDLELRPMTEADLSMVADLLPADVWQDPAIQSPPEADEQTARGIVAHQAYWRSFASWRPDAWAVRFVVSAGGEYIGTQELEARDFPVLGTVDSSSYLLGPARGRGYGKQMRAAVLALAFGPLQARAAVSSAWHDNHASLGVSRSIGYQPNGESLHAHGERVDTELHLLLKRADWLASGAAQQVTISDFEPCRHLFGLPDTGRSSSGAAG